ncbi:MAG TPA: DinB family protein [Terriglobales bacterium]|nr:DinB family protein [Terriglobales bacterium]
MAKKTAKNKSKKKSTKSSSSKKPAVPSASLDQALRDQLLDLLNGGQAHAAFDAAVGDWPVQLAGVKVANFPHTAWMLLEHMRLGQWDILEFSRNAKYVSPKWPDDYWPTSEAPTHEKAWKASMAAFKKDLRSMMQLVVNRKTDLFARIPWGNGQTILREALLVADHNAYHLGQLVMLRKSIGI